MKESPAISFTRSQLELVTCALNNATWITDEDESEAKALWKDLTRVLEECGE